MEKKQYMGLHMQVIIALLLGIKRNGHIFIGLILGVLVGLFFPKDSYGQVYSILSFIAKAFINIIQMVVLPLVISAIIIGVSNIGDSKQLAKFGSKMPKMAILTPLFNDSCAFVWFYCSFFKTKTCFPIISRLNS